MGVDDSKSGCLILTTCPDAATAERLAGGLVGEGLAACVNVLPGVRSVYRWKGQVERAEEHVLLVKSTCGRYSAIETWLRAQHPYELPEIVAVPIAAALPAYLAWLQNPQ